MYSCYEEGFIGLNIDNQIMKHPAYSENTLRLQGGSILVRERWYPLLVIVFILN